LDLQAFSRKVYLHVLGAAPLTPSVWTVATHVTRNF
jgi:hypothetical protein